MTAAHRSTALAILAAAAIYALLHFVVLGLPAVATPLFRIDYVMATVARGNDLSDVAFALYRARPVSEGWIMVQSFLGRVLLDGQVRYIVYAVQHLSILAYFFMVAHVLDHVFRARLHRLAVLAAWVVFLQCQGVIEAVYKLESFVGTVSMLFGGLSLVALVEWDRKRTRGWFVVAVAAFALSVLAKEDFIVPPLLLVAWFALRDGLHDAKTRLAPIAVAFALVIVAFLVFNRVILPGRSFIESEKTATSVYFMSFGLSSMIRTGWAYATRGEFATLLFGAWIGTTLLALVLRVRWKEALWIGLVVGGLMGPYVIMPNHQFALYAVKWMPWEALGAAMLLQCIAGERFRQASVATFAWVAFALVLGMYTFNGIAERKAFLYHAARFLNTNYGKAEKLEASLLRDRQALNQLREVAVLGVGRGALYLSPWHNRGETGFWFDEDLGLHPHWVVYVATPDRTYPAGPRRPKARVDVRRIDDFAKDKPTHAYVIAKDGSASLVDLRGKDLAAFAASWDLAQPTRWTADSRFRIGVTPESLANCVGARAAVRVDWDLTALGKDRTIDIFVQGPGGARALWMRSHASGTGETGPWAAPGMKIEFVEAGGNATPVARFVVGEARCPNP